MTGERLNFIVALCAIMISGASFYATFLQANSAEQQVKAMTWPLIEFAHGNYDVEAREEDLTLTLRNAGVGPAIVKSVEFKHRKQSYASLNQFLNACCGEAYEQYAENVKQNQFNAAKWTLTTSPSSGIILPVNGEVDFLSMLKNENNNALWQKINEERWNLDLEVCYCSLLENCYVTDKPGQVMEVPACPADP